MPQLGETAVQITSLLARFWVCVGTGVASLSGTNAT